MNAEFFTVYWWLPILGALLLSVIGNYLTRGIDIVSVLYLPNGGRELSEGDTDSKV